MYKLNANNGIISVIQTDRDQINMIFFFSVSKCLCRRTDGITRGWIYSVYMQYTIAPITTSLAHTHTYAVEHIQWAKEGDRKTETNTHLWAHTTLCILYRFVCRPMAAEPRIGWRASERRDNQNRNEKSIRFTNETIHNENKFSWAIALSVCICPFRNGSLPVTMAWYVYCVVQQRHTALVNSLLLCLHRVRRQHKPIAWKWRMDVMRALEWERWLILILCCWWRWLPIPASQPARATLDLFCIIYT